MVGVRNRGCRRRKNFCFEFDSIVKILLSRDVFAISCTLIFIIVTYVEIEISLCTFDDDIEGVAALDNKYRHSTLTRKGHGSAVVSATVLFLRPGFQDRNGKKKNNIVHKHRSITI